jgi:flagellar P-ring protein precursor FlgI
MRARLILIFLISCSTCVWAAEDAARLKDLGRFAGWRENALVGTGLVTGLAGTGDSPNSQATRQALSNVLAQFDNAVPTEQIQSRNTAVVVITASLPPFAAPGDKLDVTVTSVGDARSLAGGSLLMASLKGPDNKVYALAQGALSVGGYKYDLNGNVVQKNHPTVGSIPAGATVEVGVSPSVRSNQMLAFVLASADYTTAARVAAGINQRFGAPIARPRDAGRVEILVPEHRQSQLVEFASELESITVAPDRRARVVVNERTGTIVAGGDVRLSKVAISHGDLKISILTDNTVSQPLLVRQAGAEVRTELIANSRIDVQERGETGMVTSPGNTVADLIQALTRIKTSTRDMISILRTVKAQGALHAELEIQ